MERQQLEAAKATLRTLRDRLVAMPADATDESYSRLAESIDDLAGVVAALIEDRIVAGEHAHAVDQMIRAGGPVRHDVGELRQEAHPSRLAGRRPRVLSPEEIAAEADPRD